MYKSLFVILSFRHDKSCDMSNNNTCSGEREGGCDKYDNIGHINTKMCDTASDVNISFVKMIFVGKLIGNAFDILREWPLEDQRLTLLNSKMHQLKTRDTFDKLSNFSVLFFPKYGSVLISNSLLIESISS